MEAVNLTIYYYMSFALFFLGLFGAFLKDNLISLLLCIELSLSGLILFLVLLTAQKVVSLDAQILVFFIMVIAACEGAIGISLILALFKKLKTIKSHDLTF